MFLEASNSTHSSTSEEFYSLKKVLNFMPKISNLSAGGVSSADQDTLNISGFPVMTLVS
jgi:hypothetical protein